MVIQRGQDSFSNDRRIIWDDKMKVNVWYVLEAHRPLGSVYRLRKTSYEMSKGKREESNATEIVDVHSVDQIP